MECQCALSKINADREAQMVSSSCAQTSGDGAGDGEEMDERWMNEEKSSGKGGSQHVCIETQG